jgi:hypothetical protein
MEITPSIELKFDNFVSIKIVISTMGTSVTRGAIATLNPSFLLYFRVSDITRVSKGPGEIPAANPKTMLENKNGIAPIMI